MFENGKYGISTEISTEDLQKYMQKMLDGEINTDEIKNNLQSFDCGNSQIIDKILKIIEG